MNEVINNKKRSEILAEKILEMNFGDVILHSQIVNVIDLKYPSSAYNSTIARAKKLLKEQGYFLESIFGDGYRIIMPDNVVDHSLKHYKRGFNELNKGLDTLKHAPVTQMSSDARITYNRVADRAIRLNAAMKGVSVELKTLGKKNHPFALENIKKD